MYARVMRAAGWVLLAASGLVVLTAATAVAAPLYHARVAEPSGVAVGGRWLAWSDRGPDGDLDVFVRDLRKGGVRRVTPGGSDQLEPCIDGDLIAWVDYRGGDADIWVASLTGGAPRAITGPPYNETAPALAGRWVAYQDYENGYNARISATNVDTMVERQSISSGYGVRKLRPRGSGDLVVFESHSGVQSTTRNVDVLAYDFASSTLFSVATGTATQIMPDTDGRWIVWAETRGGNGFDIMAWDRLSGATTVVNAQAGEQYSPVVRNGVFYWLDNRPGRAIAIVSNAPDRRGKRRTVQTGASGSVGTLDVSGEMLGWLARDGSDWTAGIVRERDSAVVKIAQGAGRLGIRIARALRLPLAGDDARVFAQADVTPPTDPQIEGVRVRSAGTVEVSWIGSTDDSGPVTYEVYRHVRAVTASNIASASLVASGLAASPAVVATAADEASRSYTYYYAVAARDGAGNLSGPSRNFAPDIHGTYRTSGFPPVVDPPGAQQTCYTQWCHTSIHGSVWGALGAKTRFACYRCHGGTSASTAEGTRAASNTQRDSGDYDGQAWGSRHRNTFMETEQTECSSCHDPHRTPVYVDASGTVDPARSHRRILRVVQATDPAVYLRSTDTTPVKNALCLACHGPAVTAMSAAGGPTAWVNAGGDHETSYTAAIHGASVVLTSDANPGIQCRACHDEHGSPEDHLLGYRGTAAGGTTAAGVCLACHRNGSTETRVAAGYSAPFAWNGKSVASETARFSAHPTQTAAAGRSLTCASCHNVHRIARGGGSDWDMARLSDPANTKGTPVSPTSFCLGCHGASAPAQVVSDLQIVPFRVGFSVMPAAYFFPGWGKADFTGAGHYVTAGVRAGCETCHEPHASDFPRLAAWTRPAAFTTGTAGSRLSTSAAVVKEEALCYQCHGNGTVGKRAAGAADIASAMTGAFRHDPGRWANGHTDTETVAAIGARRHAECVDCHDPHTARKVGGSATQDATDSSVGGGALYGSIGATPAYPASIWSTPTALNAIRLTSTDGYEAYLCLKCHNGQASIPSSQTDIAREFNPANPSWHNVLGFQTGMRGSFTFRDNAGTTQTDTWFVPTANVFRPGYDSNTMLTCTSCHTSQSASGAKGPHGSSTRWMLDPAYTEDWKVAGVYSAGTGMTTNGTGDANILCAKCHDLYGPGGSGGFSNAAHDGSRHEWADMYNSQHVTCNTCHTAIPHGWKRPRLLGYQSDGPYATSGPNGLLRIRANSDHGVTGSTGANWASGDCAAGCAASTHGLMTPYWP